MVSVRWSKVWRDLWSNKGRTLVVVAAIAVGVMAFGSVFATKDILLSDMSEQYRAIHPTALTLSLPGGFTPDLVRWIVTQPQVVNARAIGQGLVRIYTSSGPRNVQLIALDDYANNQIDLVMPEQGIWPPLRGDLVFERTSLASLGKSVGDVIQVETPAGDKKILTIAGTVHDLRAIPANLFPQLTAYVTFDTLRQLGLNDNLTQLQILTDENLTTQDQVQALGDQLKTTLENRGVAKVNVSAEKPYHHWGEDGTNAFVTILTIIGSFSLILSIFLVINTITAIMSQQKKQIGIMKAVGARRPQIMSLYIVMALGYGLGALIVALPLGAVLSYYNLILVSNFLNISILHFTIPPLTLALETATALLVPLLAAVIPVYAGTKITAREAMSDFVVGKSGVSFINRLSQQLSFLSRPLLVSLRNTFRQKSRLALTLITLTLAGTMFISVLGVQTSMNHELESYLKLNNYDLELFFGDSYDQTKVLTDAHKLSGVTAAAVPHHLSTTWDDDQGNENTLALDGLSPETDFVVPTMMSGRWLKGSDTNQIVVSNKLLRDHPDLALGSSLTLKINDQNRPFTIVGVFLLPDTGQAYVNYTYFKTIAPDADQVGSVRLKTTPSDPASVTAFAQTAEESLKKMGYSVAYSLTINSIRASSQGQFSFLIFFLLIMAVLVAIVGALSLAGTMSLNVLERTREIGIIRSIGASNSSVFNIVLFESLSISLLSWLIALPLAVPVGFGFCLALGNAFFEKPLTFFFSYSGTLIWFVIVLVIAFIASYVPAKNAVNTTIRDTLAYE